MAQQVVYLLIQIIPVLMVDSAAVAEDRIIPEPVVAAAAGTAAAVETTMPVAVFGVPVAVVDPIMVGPTKPIKPGRIIPTVEW
jgi:hypothetical protein